MDREKVIKGIQECDLNGGLIGNCPYKGILALLKEQEATIKRQQNVINIMASEQYDDYPLFKDGEVNGQGEGYRRIAENH